MVNVLIHDPKRLLRTKLTDEHRTSPAPRPMAPHTIFPAERSDLNLFPWSVKMDVLLTHAPTARLGLRGRKGKSRCQLAIRGDSNTAGFRSRVAHGLSKSSSFACPDPGPPSRGLLQSRQNPAARVSQLLPLLHSCRAFTVPANDCGSVGGVSCGARMVPVGAIAVVDGARNHGARAAVTNK
ncbi:unnamed protein product [Lampetra planeri]